MLFAEEWCQVFGKDIQEHFRALQKSGLHGSELHRKVRFKKKFEAILEKRYEDAVFSLREMTPEEEAHHPRWPRRLCKRHELKRDRALRLLSKSDFVADVLAMAKHWGLGTNLCERAVPDGVWYPGGYDGFIAWGWVLEWASIKYWKENVDRWREEHRKLGEKFLEDLDFPALFRGVDAILAEMPAQRFRTELAELAGRYGLDALWHRALEALLLEGIFCVPRVDCRMVVQRSQAGDRVFYEVFAETRKQDLMDKWSDTTGLLKQLFPGRRERRKARPQLERDLATRAKRDAGRSLEHILVWDYALDEKDDRFESWGALAAQEDLLLERLRKGSEGVKQAQDEATRGPAAPSLPGWVHDDIAEVTSVGVREWYF